MQKDFASTLAALVVGAVPVLLIPYAILKASGGFLGATPAFLKVCSFILAVIGILAVGWVALVFPTKGKGTPVPILPPKEFVAHGLYRYVRNPMYLGALLILVAEAAFFGSPMLLLYTAFVGVALHAFLVLLEEPQLERRFGDTYRQYKARTPRWIPRSPSD